MKKLKIAYMKLFTKTIREVAPAFAKKYAKKTLFTPQRSRATWPNHVRQFTIPTRSGEVKAYKHGEGKCVWLIHGWSGSGYDFWPLIQQLVENGYSTFTFDFPAHGNTDGKYCTLPTMINVFDDIANSIFEPHLVIAHGLGASTIANSQWIRRYHENLLLVSPELNSYHKLYSSIEKSGFDRQLFDQAIHQLYHREKMLLPELNALSKLDKFAGKLKVVNDKDNTTSPFCISEKLSRLSSCSLVTTNELGYYKILKSRKMLPLIESFEINSTHAKVS